MNKIHYMSHKFKNIKSPDYILYQSGFIPRGTCVICEACNLIVQTEIVSDEFIDSNEGHDHSDYFYLNSEEVYCDIIVLEDLNITCDEMIIKNIIE